MDKLTRITIDGFKSISNLDLSLGDINVIIGANAAGKSNFISLFEMIGHLLKGELELYVGKAGGASTLLYYGAKQTPHMRFVLHFKTQIGTSEYIFRLSDAAQDTLVFTEEVVESSRSKHQIPEPLRISLGGGQKETKINEIKDGSNKKTVIIIKNILESCKVFQFHDTSKSSNIRKKNDISDVRYLRADGSNLAAYLYKLQLIKPEIYQRIVSLVNLVAPHFRDFELAPDQYNSSRIMLRWMENNSDYVFGPHQISDGLLRFVALATLLSLPDGDLPSLLIIDEPELGLHPYAINVLGSLIRKVSHECQVIIATQSVNLLDQFVPEDVIVVNRREGESHFQKLSSESLSEWLEDYSLSELWEKNVIEGRP